LIQRPSDKICRRRSGAKSRNPFGKRFLGLILTNAVLLTLLVGPALAVLQLPIDPLVAFGYATFVSLLTFAFYARDKKLAQIKGASRISEATLHTFELIGGWPGAFLAQRIIRHKNAKRSYQHAFWLIVLTHEAIALDCLLDWRITSAIWDHIGPI
jgi:uncharacterized membrane protein YsdA (DUF1294 family)